MIQWRDCTPQNLKSGETPDYVCLPNGRKHYLSMEEKKDYQYGGACARLSDIFNRGICPDISGIADQKSAKATCLNTPGCVFIGNQVLNRNGPNYCYQPMPGTIPITEDVLANDDKELTEKLCQRMERGCVFNRGNGDGIYTRKGSPACLRGCLGTKYWNNPKYMWGGGGTPEDPFSGSYYNSDLKVGAKYLETAPSIKRPTGWGGPIGEPYNGHGKLPRILGIPYTETKGEYSPPCNIRTGDQGLTPEEDLAGPGCKLTPPKPQYGIFDWSFTCACPYLGQTGVMRPDGWLPCADWQLKQDTFSNRNVCEGCYIQPDSSKALYGHCVLGEESPDTESEILGCVKDPFLPEKCRVKRWVSPTECPHFCKNDDDTWRSETQCYQALVAGSWKVNPEYQSVLSKTDIEQGKQANPYIKINDNFKVKDTDYLCENCSQTPVISGGTGTDYPNRSYCIVGGTESTNEYNASLARSTVCPPTCRQCLKGYFGEPMKPIYKLEEASNESSAFRKGPIYVPWVGTQAVAELTAESQKFDRTQ